MERVATQKRLCRFSFEEKFSMIMPQCQITRGQWSNWCSDKGGEGRGGTDCTVLHCYQGDSNIVLTLTLSKQHLTLNVMFSMCHCPVAMQLCIVNLFANNQDNVSDNQGNL